MAVDAKKLEQFGGQFITDLEATVHVGMVVIGGRLGLYKALRNRKGPARDLRHGQLNMINDRLPSLSPPDGVITRFHEELITD